MTAVPPAGTTPIPTGSGGMNTAGSESAGMALPMTGGERAGADTAGEAAGEVAGERVMSCTEDDSLGLCEVCGSNNDSVAPQDDANCPEVDCAGFTQYSVVEGADGSPVCERTSFTAGDGRCRDIGVCVEDPLEYCVASETEPVELDGVISECMALMGCEGADAPILTPLTDQPCDEGAGVCDDSGVCQPTRSCDTLFEWQLTRIIKYAPISSMSLRAIVTSWSSPTVTPSVITR